MSALTSQPTDHDDRCRFPTAGAHWSHCPSCHEDFRSDTAFDRHRIGRIGAGRRCATPAEMTAAGMLCDQWGRWRCPPRADTCPPWRTVAAPER